MRTLVARYRNILKNVDTSYVRNIHSTIPWNDRLIAILGARGVGKTMLVLQHIKLYEDVDTTLFVYADDLWFSTHSLVTLAEMFYTNGGRVLYIDEIHKYKNWSQEIKNIYDQYPDLKVRYTGSSILDLQKGSHDLSRRVLEFQMHGLSFREYVALHYGADIPIHTLEQVLANKIEFPYTNYRPVALFKEYLRQGYYPYFKEPGYELRLTKTINAILEVDIPKFAELSISTSEKLKTLLYIVAQSVPFKPNYSKIARDLDMHRNAVSDLMVWLDKADLINILRDDVEGYKLLGKVNKIYLNNPNLAYALSDDEPNIGNIRETIFLAWLRATHKVTASSVSDFKVGKYTFEVGGKKKGQHQIKDVEHAYVVKDDIEYGHLNEVPLWAFGLLY
ncbi:MAG: AAA family ATPase [Bacteroidaceae bacterium]|nr:AAA family ATPase [Bacteroidaceae bacterium]